MGYLPSDYNNISVEGVNTKRMASRTWRMDVEGERIRGIITGHVEAVKQSVYKILNTERYKHIIYSANYGAELSELFGKPIPYVIPEIPRRIEEALLQDDRIVAVDGFALSFDRRGHVRCDFVVHSVYGAFDAGKEVNIG